MYASYCTHTHTYTGARARRDLKTAEDGTRLLLCGAFTQSYYTRISLWLRGVISNVNNWKMYYRVYTASGKSIMNFIGY